MIWLYGFILCLVPWFTSALNSLEFSECFPTHFIPSPLDTLESSVKAKISSCPLNCTLATFISSCLPNQCTIIVDIINKALEIRLVPSDLKQKTKTFHSSVNRKEQSLANSSTICLSMNFLELVSDYITEPGMFLSRAQMTSSLLRTLPTTAFSFSCTFQQLLSLIPSFMMVYLTKLVSLV